MNIDFVGEIGESITVESIRSQLAAARGQAITCRFFSDGGSVFEGFAISNALREYPGRKVAVVDCAFSIASYIAFCSGFNQVRMSSNGWAMVHSPYSENDESSPTEQRLLGSLTTQLAEGYSLRAKKPLATIQKMMAEETFLSVSDCVRLGFADSVTATGQTLAIAARLKDKIQAKMMIVRSALQQWKALVKIHGSSKANIINPTLRLRVIKEAN